MDSFFAFLQAPGLLAISAALFAKRMGLPLPALPFLLLAGARGAGDLPFALLAFLAASAAAVAADAIWFAAGRRYGRAVLAWTCRISMSPGSCISRSESAFARHGGLAVLLAKFLPGVAGLAPPLAGALGMRGVHFQLLNAAGTLLWTGTGIAAGLLFHRQVDQLLDWLARLGSAAAPLVGAALALYIALRAIRRWLARKRAAQTPAAGESAACPNA